MILSCARYSIRVRKRRRLACPEAETQVFASALEQELKRGGRRVNILEVEGLCKTYPAFELRDVSFAVAPGTIMGFIGRNGAGKSTTIKAMLNLVHPDSGRVTMFGQDFLRQ